MNFDIDDTRNNHYANDDLQKIYIVYHQRLKFEWKHFFQRFSFFHFTSNWFTTCKALFSKKTGKTVGAIRMIISWCKSLTSQWIFTMCTCKTFTMPRENIIKIKVTNQSKCLPWLIFVCDTTLSNHLCYQKYIAFI